MKTCSIMPTIMICFVRADSSLLEESWLNRAASWLATTDDDRAPYIHAEVLFIPKGAAFNRTSNDVSGMACSIVYGNTVHLEPKRFSRTEWEFRSMTVSEEAYDRMYAVAEERRGDGFNHLGYFLHPLYIQPRPMFYTWFGMRPRWYCSEIVSHILKAGGIFEPAACESIHPHELYKNLKTVTMADCGRNMKSVTLQFV